MTPQRVQTPLCEAGQVAVCAGLNSKSTRAAVLLSNFNTADGTVDLVVRELPWKSPTGFELYLVDADRDFQSARRGTLAVDGRLALPEVKAPAVALLKLSPLPAPSR